MSSDKGGFGLDGPIVGSSVEVSVANSSSEEFDQTLSRCELGLLPDGVVMPDLDVCTGVGDNSGSLDLGDNVGHGGNR